MFVRPAAANFSQLKCQGESQLCNQVHEQAQDIGLCQLAAISYSILVNNVWNKLGSRKRGMLNISGIDSTKKQQTTHALALQLCCHFCHPLVKELAKRGLINPNCPFKIYVPGLGLKRSGKEKKKLPLN